LYCDLTCQRSQAFRGYLISPVSIQLLTRFNLASSLVASACYCLNLDTETCSLCAPTHLSPTVINCSSSLFIEGGLLIRFVDFYFLGLQIKDHDHCELCLLGLEIYWITLAASTVITLFPEILK
jgi:hypothetical protein